MTLLDVVRNLDSLDPDSTLYLAEPWRPESIVVVTSEPDSGGVPPEAQALGCSYFLEVFVAQEFLDGWRQHRAETPTHRESCVRLIEYATNDA